MKNIRVRFAPSPTGFLHIGSIRPLLVNYIFAKKFNGKFILRIEDTDEKRKVEGAVEQLLKICDWLGFKFDEGPHVGGPHGPYVQSERTAIYKKHIDQLLEEKKAYKCFCTPDRLNKMREEQQAKKLPPKYDRKCIHLSVKEIAKKEKAGESYVVRQKIQGDKTVKVFDELRGEIEFNISELDDHVLLKSTGTPTYQFANVVDDHLMEISHVIRGDEWIPSLPKNILLYQALGWKAPSFIHLPLILNKEGGKLSKRQGDVAVEDYKKKGYLSKSLINFSALLGWHPKDDNEILSLDEIIDLFEVKDMGISPAVFDIDKLDYFNGYYIREMKLEDLLPLVKPFIEDNFKLTKNPDKLHEKFLKNIIRTEQERVKKLSDFTEATKFFFQDELKYSPDMLIWKKLAKNDIKLNLEDILIVLDKIDDNSWTQHSIEEALISHIKLKEMKVGDYLWPMRVSLSGSQKSPGPFEIAEALGKSETMLKIQKAITLL